LSDHLRAHDAALARLQALHPKLIDLSLDRMLRLCAALDRPQDRLPPVIHVAGTNGKGSTVAYLRAMAEAAGLKVHVFTSPHLVRFAERIRLAGTLITDEHLADVLERVEQANAGLPITFFEITTAAAFVAFAEAPADLCIVEVGLGGILDATNVVTPKVSVIAPVDIDHREFLGDTIAKIAQEKAGIIKSGAPVVSARQHEEAEAVIEAAATLARVPLTLMGRDFDAWNERGRLLVQMQDRLLDLPAPSLPGEHQFANAGLAVAALLTLDDPRIDEAAMGAGIAGTVWPARFQRLAAGPAGRKGQGGRRRPLARRRPQSSRRRGRGPGAGRSGGPRRSARGADLRVAGQQGRHRLFQAVRAAEGPGVHRHLRGPRRRAGRPDRRRRRTGRSPGPCLRQRRGRPGQGPRPVADPACADLRLALPGRRGAGDEPETWPS
jgi:hypothetical protein